MLHRPSETFEQRGTIFDRKGTEAPRRQAKRRQEAVRHIGDPALRVSASPRFIHLAAVVVIVAGGLFSRSASAQGQRSIPTQTYFSNFTLLYGGEYRDALKGFASERGIRAGQSRWIDSICYQTMTGESYYKLGQYSDALASYTAALNLYVAYANWMTSLNAPPTLSAVATVPACPGVAARATPRSAGFKV